MPFPGPIGPGLIEAIKDSKNLNERLVFPGPIGPGLIEAILRTERGNGSEKFPGPIGPGLIEAVEALALPCCWQAHFPAQLGRASLKR